jgi:hypothetical protein
MEFPVRFANFRDFRLHSPEILLFLPRAAFGTAFARTVAERRMTPRATAVAYGGEPLAGSED